MYSFRMVLYYFTSSKHKTCSVILETFFNYLCMYTCMYARVYDFVLSLIHISYTLKKYKKLTQITYNYVDATYLTESHLPNQFELPLVIIMLFTYKLLGIFLC